jgi:hypothetical protein
VGSETLKELDSELLETATESLNMESEYQVPSSLVRRFSSSPIFFFWQIPMDGKSIKQLRNRQTLTNKLNSTGRNFEGRTRSRTGFERLPMRRFIDSPASCANW